MILKIVYGVKFKQNLLTKVVGYRCSLDREHEIVEGKKFCPDCGAGVISDADISDGLKKFASETRTSIGTAIETLETTYITPCGNESENVFGKVLNWVDVDAEVGNFHTLTTETVSEDDLAELEMLYECWGINIEEAKLHVVLDNR